MDYTINERQRRNKLILLVILIRKQKNEVIDDVVTGSHTIFMTVGSRNSLMV